MVLLLLCIALTYRVTVTGPAGMSLGRSTFFVLNAASLTGFDMSWTSPTVMTAPHAVICILVVLLSAVLSSAIATRAFIAVSGWDWPWRRLWIATLAFIAALWALSCATELLAGCPPASAAWNACMVTTGTGLLAGDSRPADPLLWLVRFPVAALAALGPFILLDTLRRRSSMTRVSKLTWLAVPASFLFAIALVAGVERLSTDDLVPAVITAVDARGAGFTDTSRQVNAPTRWVLIPVLLLGGPSGGVGGGLKAITAAVLVIGLAQLLRNGRGGAGRTFAIAAVWLAALVLLFGATLVLLLVTGPQLRPDRAALMAAAACGNAGISIDPVSSAGADAYVLAGAMMLGRILPWIVLWWSATRGDEDGVAVG